MIRTAAAVALLAIGATYAIAQSTGVKAIEERKELMESTDKLTRPVSKMAKGEQPFDLAKVKEAVKVAHTNITKAMTLFPDDSKQGAETRAKAEVWTNRDAFKAKYDQFAKAAKEADGAINDEATFKTEFKKVDDACNSCHKEFRASRKR
jgi:cytochrome c556